MYMYFFSVRRKKKPARKRSAKKSTRFGRDPTRELNRLKKDLGRMRRLTARQQALLEAQRREERDRRIEQRIANLSPAERQRLDEIVARLQRWY